MSTEAWTDLATVDHEWGVAAVRRRESDGTLWLTADMVGNDERELEGYRIVEEEKGDVVAYAGAVPPGVAREGVRPLEWRRLM